MQKTFPFSNMMKDRIIEESIGSLREEGLKFSVDTLAERLKISKKTVYKYFPDKETLAAAIYERYYAEAEARAEARIERGGSALREDLLRLYFEAKTMIRADIFNKFRLNERIYTYAAARQDALWEKISAVFSAGESAEERQAVRVIVDGTFEKICNARFASDAVIERLVNIL